MAQCISASHDRLHVCIVQESDDRASLFLVNRSDRDVEAKAAELFGFGLGNFVEKPPGNVAFQSFH